MSNTDSSDEATSGEEGLPLEQLSERWRERAEGAYNPGARNGFSFYAKWLDMALDPESCETIQDVLSGAKRARSAATVPAEEQALGTIVSELEEVA